MAVVAEPEAVGVVVAEGAAGEVEEVVGAEAGVVMEVAAAETVVAQGAAGKGGREGVVVDKTGVVVVALDQAAVVKEAVVVEEEVTAEWMSAAAGRAVKAATVVMVG